LFQGRRRSSIGPALPARHIADERPLPKSNAISEGLGSSREPLLVRPLSDRSAPDSGSICRRSWTRRPSPPSRAFLDHLVVIFPGQTLTPEQQIRFARRFGPIMIDPFIKSMAGYPEILEVVKEKHERVAFGESWHSDSTYLEQPPLGSLLYSKEVPPFGGDTMFANQYLAYEALSPGLRRVVDGLTAIHSPWSYEAARAGGGVYNEQRTMKLRNDEVMQEAMKIVTEHPVVHPSRDRPQGALCQFHLYPELQGLDEGGEPPAAGASLPPFRPARVHLPLSLVIRRACALGQSLRHASSCERLSRQPARDAPGHGGGRPAGLRGAPGPVCESRDNKEGSWGASRNSAGS
jgi:hypothetical protein